MINSRLYHLVTDKGDTSYHYTTEDMELMARAWREKGRKVFIFKRSIIHERNGEVDSGKH